MVLFLVILGPYLLHLFGKNYAAEAGLLLRLLSLAILPEIITGLYFAIARIQRSVGGVVEVPAGLFIMNLALSYLLIEKFGITGVGIVWLISHVMIALVLFFTQLRSILWLKPVDTLASWIRLEHDIHGNIVHDYERTIVGRIDRSAAMPGMQQIDYVCER